MYGIDESAAVLGNLYGVKADYYARVNFAGLKKIVDALDGVDVNSDYEFTTVGMEVPNENGDGVHMAGYTFTKGINHLNGEQALCFARERHAFDDGDNQRGKNQMAVIRAIVDKASSPAILKGYQKVLDAVSTSFITSLTYEDISSSLVQMQACGTTFTGTSPATLSAARAAWSRAIPLEARSCGSCGPTPPRSTPPRA